MGDAARLGRYLDRIKEIKMFKYLNPEDLNLLLGEAEVVHYAPGDQIISQGGLSEYLFVVLAGSVEVSIQDDKGKSVFVCKIDREDVFGEGAIFISQKRTASVTSAEPSTMLRIHRADILYFIKQRPKGGIKLLMLIINSLLNKLRKANLEIVLEKGSDINLDNIDPLIREIMDQQ
ncbi:MAG: cyclic nucleotide-binding domain-containing protein [Thermodesulfobacteriota bacterium]